MRVDFWDVVQVCDDVEDIEIRGCIGYVAGIGEIEGDQVRSIGVLLYTHDRLWCLRDEEIVPLGYKDEIAQAAQGAWTAQGRSLTIEGQTGTVLD